MWNFNKEDRLRFGDAFQKGGQGSFAVKQITTVYENLIQMPK
jgi:hypothetical protein